MEEENDLLVASDNLKKQIAEQDKKREQDKLKVMSSTFGSLSQLLGASTEDGKKMAIAQAMIDTFAATQSAFAAMSSIPPDPAWGVVAAAAAVLAGIANVKKIMEVKVPGESDGSSSVSASASCLLCPPCRSFGSRYRKQESTCRQETKTSSTVRRRYLLWRT